MRPTHYAQSTNDKSSAPSMDTWNLAKVIFCMSGMGGVMNFYVGNKVPGGEDTDITWK